MAPPHVDEKVSARPDISPGVVEDHERLLRALFNPDHVKDGEVLVTAISLTDLSSRGFSVHRTEFVSPPLVQSLIDKFLSRLPDGQQRKFEGVARLETRDVREIKENGKQLFVAIDTAMQSRARVDLPVRHVFKRRPRTGITEVAIAPVTRKNLCS